LEGFRNRFNFFYAIFSAGPSGDEATFEGMLVRKHEWESTTKKASNRSWDKVYCQLINKQLAAYKDQKHTKAETRSFFHNEQPIELEGASAAKASDYQKRPHVFRLKLANGGDYLYQCKDDDEMNTWIGRINNAAGGEGGSTPARAQTLPAQGARDEPKRRSFFTLGKKK